MDEPVLKIIMLTLCHLVGDYVLQTSFIAETKGVNWYHLFVHCALYILPFVVVFGFVWQAIIIFAAHLVIDPLKARWKKINYWTDQTLHYLTMLIYFI